MIYAGTGKANNSADSYYGSGILVSTNGGATWTLNDANGALFGRTVSKIAVDPTDANIAYAAVADFGANGQLGNTGIWKTTDGGATWVNTTTSLPSLNFYDTFADVVVDPNNPSTVYATVGSYFGDTANGVYKSTDSGADVEFAERFGLV